MCGIVGVWNPATADQTEAARLVFFSLYALQHRGQESAGIAATDGSDLRLVRRMGLVGQVFGEPDLGVLGGRAAIGHTRYSTTGSSRIQNAQPMLRGAWSLVILTPSALYAVRDPLGVRPLCLGRKGDAWLVASETCGLETVGATFVRDVAPGEVLRIDDRGPVPIADFAADRRGLCVFEHVYLASAASDLGGVSVYATRERMGETLADEHPADADVVIPVPDSAIPAAVGYARRSGIPFREGLIKNRYIGRTFIQPSPELRQQGVALKYNALRDVLEDKRVVVVDDSIVRGSTSGPIVELLRGHGAKEVHLRICSPPLRHQCFFGVDMARRDELIASQLDVDSIRRHVGADSLGYLSLEGMVRATGGTVGELCTACFTGDYLVPVQLELAKDSLESEKVRA